MKRLEGFLVFMLTIFLLVSRCGIFEIEEEEEEKANTVSLTFTVAGKIQTDDPWTTGSIAVNEWSKPMYYIWFDMNGDFNDGPYGNSVGSKQAYLRLDTGKLYFEWNGKHGNKDAGEQVDFWTSSAISASAQSENDVEMQLVDDGSSFRITFPLSRLGNPSSMEVGFMCSPWTTSASDNLGPSTGQNKWFVISDATAVQSMSKDDPSGDNGWPELSPNRKENFDMIKAQVRLEMK